MTIEEAKEILNRVEIAKPIKFEDYADMREALDMAIKALEQQSSEDCISRAYIESIVEELENICINGDEYMLSLLSDIKNAPSVTPQHTSWIPVSEKPQEGRYLCTYEHWYGKCIDFGSFDGESWYIKPIAYMPLPEPYNAESENNVCEDCYYNDGEVHAECVICDKAESENKE